jgi:adenosine deaminase
MVSSCFPLMLNPFLQNKNTFVGIDLAGDEASFSCKTFAPLFQMAKRNGLHVTVHAGEVIH